MEYRILGKTGLKISRVGEGRRRFGAKDIRRAPQQGRCAEPILGNVRHKDKSSPASATKKDSQPYGWLSFFICSAGLEEGGRLR